MRTTMFEMVFPLMAGSNLTDAATGGMGLILASFLFLMLLTFIPALVRLHQLR